jgi:hypothetical protein
LIGSTSFISLPLHAAFVSAELPVKDYLFEVYRSAAEAQKRD